MRLACRSKYHSPGVPSSSNAFTTKKGGAPRRSDQIAPGSSGAVVCRLFENIFAPGEVTQSGPIRVAGPEPRVFLSWHLMLPDGKVTTGPEIEATGAVPPPAAKPAPKPRGRRR